MPCNGGYTDAQFNQRAKRSLAQKKRKREKRKQEIQYVLNLEAMLCAVLSEIEGMEKEHHIQILERVLLGIHLKKYGITSQDVVSWWYNHKKEDGLRKSKAKLKELESKSKSKVKLTPLEKLSLTDLRKKHGKV